MLKCTLCTLKKPLAKYYINVQHYRVNIIRSIDVDFEFEQYTVRLHIANLHFLTNIPTKYQPPTPYSLKDMSHKM